MMSVTGAWPIRADAPGFATPLLVSTTSNETFIQDYSDSEIIHGFQKIQVPEDSKILSVYPSRDVFVGGAAVFAFSDLDNKCHVGTREEIATTIREQFFKLSEFAFLRHSIAKFLRDDFLLSQTTPEVERLLKPERPTSSVLHFPNLEMQAFSDRDAGRQTLAPVGRLDEDHRDRKDEAINVSLIGPFDARVNDRRLHLRSRKARALLGYLALAPRAAETLENLTGLLWSESEENKARSSLRKVLYEIRESAVSAGCENVLLQIKHSSLWLDSSLVSTDIGEVLKQAQEGQAHPLLLEIPGLPGKLMEDLRDVDHAFKVWLIARRQEIHDQLIALLERRLHDPGADQRRIAQAILRLDPTHEVACRAIMEAAATQGDTSAALRAYEQLWKVLSDEYDTEPSVATQELVANIKLGHFSSRIASPIVPSAISSPPAAPLRTEVKPPPPATTVSLLVEPFKMNSLVPEMVRAIQAFRHVLIACILQSTAWGVVDGSTRPRNIDVSRHPSTYRVLGNAYQTGDRIRLTLTLAERDSDLSVWSECFEVGVEDWLKLQESVVRRTVAGLSMHISHRQIVAPPNVSHTLTRNDEP